MILDLIRRLTRSIHFGESHRKSSQNYYYDAVCNMALAASTNPDASGAGRALASLFANTIRASFLCALALHLVIGPIYYTYFATLPYSSSVVFVVSLTVARFAVFTVAHGFFGALDVFKLLQ